MSYTSCIGKLYGIFQLDVEGEDLDGRTEGFESFCDEIKQEAGLQHRSSSVGRRFLEGVSARRDRDERPQSPTFKNHLDDLERFFHYRAASPDRADSDGGVINGGKRPKLERGELPWTKADNDFLSSSVNSPPECDRNRRLLRTLSKDYSFALNDLRLSPRAPPGFPSPEWNNIIRGHPVNLDVVLSSLHHVHPAKENVARLGDHDISFPQVESAKRVQTAADWAAAWHLTARAYSFVFEWREQEIWEYGDYIERMFASRIASAAPKIILLDKAIRNFVAGGQTVLLNSFARFSHINDAILSPEGVENHGGDGEQRGANKRKRAFSACDKFNRQSGCSAADGKCRYPHICKSCGKGGHGQTTCQGRGRDST